MTWGKIDTSDDGKRFFIKGSNDVINKVLAGVPGSRETRNGGAHVGASPTSAHDLVQALQGIDMEYDDAWLECFQNYTGTHSEAEVARTASFEQLPPFDSGTKPWLHQAQAFWFLQPLPAGALFSDMGTGKTKVVVDLICNNKDLDNVLIIGPLKAVEDGLWTREFEKHGSKYVDVHELGPSFGKVAERASHLYDLFTDEWRHSPTVAVINYDALDQKVMRDALEAVVWDLVVLDESHRIKATTGVRSKFLGKLGRSVARRLILTGTPNADKPIDVWGQFRFLDPSIFGNYTEFKRRYCITQLRSAGGHYFEEILGYQNLDHLADRMASVAFRVTSDVLDLPEQHDVVRVVRLGTEAQGVYSRMEKDALATVEEEGDVLAQNVLTKYLRLQEITSGYVRADYEDEATGSRNVRRFDTSKADATLEIVEDINADEPIVVFYRFTQDAEILSHLLNVRTDRAVWELSGRHNDLEDWKVGAESGVGPVLLVQIQSGAEAIDLTAARYVVYYSTDFSLARYEQSRKRVHRPGQTRPVTYFHIQAEGTVDEYIWAALQGKSDIATTISQRILEKHGRVTANA